MKKEAEMIRQKKEMVEKRRKLVRNACEECNSEGIKITYKEISERTAIPVKTLQRNPYKDDISYYRNINNDNQSMNTETQQLREQIAYLNKIIKQLHKENHELKTRLYYEDKL